MRAPSMRRGELSGRTNPLAEGVMQKILILRIIELILTAGSSYTSPGKYLSVYCYSGSPRSEYRGGMPGGNGASSDQPGTGSRALEGTD